MRSMNDTAEVNGDMVDSATAGRKGMSSGDGGEITKDQEDSRRWIVMTAISGRRRVTAFVCV